MDSAAPTSILNGDPGSTDGREGLTVRSSAVGKTGGSGISSLFFRDQNEALRAILCTGGSVSLSFRFSLDEFPLIESLLVRIRSPKSRDLLKRVVWSSDDWVSLSF